MWSIKGFECGCSLAAVTASWGVRGVRVIYVSFGGATVHGDVAYSTKICSHLEYVPAALMKFI